MKNSYPPVNPKFPHFLHGGDYNPEQWPREMWDEDMRLMKLAHCNTMSVGIFSWAKLEPQEGAFDFSWLDRIMDMLAENGMNAILATPGGARPAWMSQKYPEVLRVTRERRNKLHGLRHNHCYTSPVYRDKTGIINRKLAERYKDHPALLMWHVNNEYGGQCHCELCQEAFRDWLRKRYNNTLDALNQAWWTTFWSRVYTDWSQIESPSPIGEFLVHGMNIDWMRFVTHQTVDFFKHEIQPLRELTPDVPLTTNFMGTYTGLNYWEFAKEVDVVSWDNYPAWHCSEDDIQLGAYISFVYDINRCMKDGRPFMLMESVPSAVNWMSTCKLKRPGMHLLSSMQAVAHGSDTVQYFQWRKGRGASEKFHGAVVDHAGHENTRVFRDVAEVGTALEKLDNVIGTTVRPDVAVVYDWENRWAIDDMEALNRGRRNYLETCAAHYRQFWYMGIPVDVIDQTCDISRYRLVVLPMLYMLRPGMAEKVKQFVENGGTVVMTYWSGIVNESDLCFTGGWPGEGLRDVFGIWDEETDGLAEDDRNGIAFSEDNYLKLAGTYEARDICALIHAEGAEVLATYSDDFYAGRPAVMRNIYGKGTAYYIASRNDEAFLRDFYQALSNDIQIKPVLDTELPEGITVQKRTDGEREFIFIMNFSKNEQSIDLGTGTFRDMINSGTLSGTVLLASYGVVIAEHEI
jgi:beta-galactosidase